MASTRIDSWLRHLGGDPHATATLVCLPHAGGSAGFFRPWRTMLPDAIRLVGVQYPGRMDRLREPGPADLVELAELAATSIEAHCRGRVCLFGHSMGAAVAYEITLRASVAAGLVVSGLAAPNRLTQRTRHRGSDAELWRALVDVGGVDAGVAANREFRELVLPAFRSDLRLIETYGPRPVVPVGVPLHVFTGTEDPQVSLGEATAWSRFTTTHFDLTACPGDHFFLANAVEAILAAVAAIMSNLGGNGP